MSLTLRVSLTIFSIGFAIEGSGELYSVLTGGRFRPGVNLLFLLPVVMTVAGLLFVWIGRHEWGELHRDRVRQAHIVFGLSVLGAAVAGAVLAVLVFWPSLGVPAWAEVLFGASAASLVLGTFVTYVYLVFHLVGPASRGILAASILWSLAVSALIGLTVAVNLAPIVGLVQHRQPVIPGFVSPLDSLSSYLFLSYFLLLAAYVDAHRRVASGARPPTARGSAAD